MHPLFEPFLKKQKYMVLDGAMATELEKKGADLNHPLWSAKILMENPELIFQVHSDYLEAGADIITTSSYQASIEGFEKAGVGEKESIELLKKSTQLALGARVHFLKKASPVHRPLVAISIGPYGAFLADGSEYNGDYGVGVDEMKKFHQRRLSIFDESGADILLFETIPSLLEATAIIQILNELPVITPAVLSFSCRDNENINDGSPISKVAELVQKEKKIIGFGINCTAPKYISSLLRAVKKHCSKPLVVYPNSGEQWNAELKSWESACSNDIVFVDIDKWVKAGAKIIGGCCRTTPEQIKILSKNKVAS